MTSFRDIINPNHIEEYQTPALIHSPNESKKSEPYQIRRREVTKNDMRQIPNIINSIDTTVKSQFKLRNPYHHEGNINYLLSQLVYSIFQNDGIPSSSHNKLICKFGDYTQMDILVYKNDNTTYEIDFLCIVGDGNIINELKTKILCDVNTNYFNHLYL